MIKKLFVLPAVLLCLGVNLNAAPNTPEGQTLEASSQPVQIASGGKALMPIVISPESSEELKKTAAELAGYLKQITGAEFLVEQGKDAKGITLGTLKQFPDTALNEPLAIKDIYDGVEAFAIRSDAGRIRLIANTDLGASHAAYRFLELLGCRWYFPGQTWEILPQSSTLSFALNETTRPAIWSRLIGIGRIAESEPKEPNLRTLLAPWFKQNGLGQSLVVNASHAWHAIATTMKEEFKAHPEYYALVKGKRHVDAEYPQLCVSNPGLQKVVIAYVNKYFEKNPNADMVSLDPADQPNWCTCDECKKLGHHSTQPFYLANIVARELKKTYPTKFIGVLAYSWHSMPPDFNMEPNVYIALTNGFNVGQYTFDELLKLWSEKCQTLGIYEYYSVWLSNKGIFPGGRAAYVDHFEPRMKEYLTKNVKSIIAEATSDWGLHGLGHYVASKVMWNTSTDVPFLKKDFYTKAFGPASAVMERYFERVNGSNNPLPGKSLLVQCANDLAEASALAKDNPDVLARITALKEFLIYNYLVQRIKMSYPQGLGIPDAAPDTKTSAADLAIQKKLTLDLLEWSYRTRNNMMTQWTMTRSIVGRPASERYSDPTIFWRNTQKSGEANPWKNPAPVTPEETDKKLAEMKAEFGEVPPIKEKKFSDHMVLVQTDQKGGNDVSKGMFINSHTSLKTNYLLVSQKGEPLKFQIEKDVNDNAPRPDVRYTLTDNAGKQVLSGQVSKGVHELELKVPGPGVYTFACNARDSWTITLPKETPNALATKKGEKFMVASIDAPLFFYVPKGTTEIVFYPGEGGSMVVRDPENKVVYDKVADGGYVTIPVSNGQSGKIWSLGTNTLRLNYLWFFNIPNAFSSNPGLMFVPKDVAAADGLNVITP